MTTMGDDVTIGQTLLLRKDRPRAGIGVHAGSEVNVRATEYNVNSPGDVFSDVFVSVAAMMTEWSYGAGWVVVVWF